jgi:hypothetical protein
VHGILTEKSLNETNDYINNLRLNDIRLNHESSTEPFNSNEVAATIEYSSRPTHRKTHSIKRKLEDYVLIQNFHDERIDYKTFAKSLLQKKEKSNCGLID